MVRNLFLRYVCIFLTGAMLAACGSGPQREEPAEEPAEIMDEEVMDSRAEAVRFLVDKYHFTEENLEGIDVEAFISDYGLRDVFYRLFPTDEIPETGNDLDAGSDIVTIGFYENPGSLQKMILFDIDGGLYYVDDATPHRLDADSIASLKGVCRDTPVCSWDHRTVGERGGTTGSYAWKMVFLLRDGAECVYGGWTDTDVLPAGYEQVTDIFYSAVSL